MIACLNCGAPLTGPYCAACGQKARPPDPTLGEFLRETLKELTHLDGKVPTTLKALLTQPGALTRDVLHGRRARWLPPLRLYLICSIAYFLTAPLVEAVAPSRLKSLRVGVTFSGVDSLTAEERAELDSSAVFRWLGRERAERVMADPAAFNRAVFAAFPKAMFVLLPLFALLTNAAYRKTAPHYPAHLYFALHEHAAGFAALTAGKVVALARSDVLSVAAGLAALGYMGWHAFRAARVVFGGSFGRTLAKAAAVGVVYWLSFIFVAIGLMAITFARL